jgi:hypothetical protein
MPQLHPPIYSGSVRRISIVWQSVKSLGRATISSRLTRGNSETTLRPETIWYVKTKWYLKAQGPAAVEEQAAKGGGMKYTTSSPTI